MEKLEIRDTTGCLQVRFDGTTWEFFEQDGLKEPTGTIDHDDVVESPFLLYYQLKNIGDADSLMNEVEKGSTELKDLVEAFRDQRRNLAARIILFEASGSGFVDEFTDIVALTGNAINGFQVKASIQTDFSDMDSYQRNAIGEVITFVRDDIKDAGGLIEAVEAVMSDDRFEFIEWSWNEILRKLDAGDHLLAEEVRLRLPTDR